MTIGLFVQSNASRAHLKFNFKERTLCGMLPGKYSEVRYEIESPDEVEKLIGQSVVSLSHPAHQFCKRCATIFETKINK